MSWFVICSLEPPKHQFNFTQFYFPTRCSYCNKKVCALMFFLKSSIISGWVIDWLTCQQSLKNWLTAWLPDCLTNGPNWLFDWLTYRPSLTNWMNAWQTDRTDRLTTWQMNQTDCPTDWLTVWLTNITVLPFYWISEKLTVSPIDWLANWRANWLADWQVVTFAGWHKAWMTDRWYFTDWLNQESSGFVGEVNSLAG